MLAKKSGVVNVFDILKARFPHVDLQILNPELSFSQNLQNIIGQLGLPSSFEVGYQITTMKQAVDKQELKIQKSLVNDQNVDINSRFHRNPKDNQIEQENNQDYHIEKQYHHKGVHQVNINEMIEQIWMFQSVHAHTDWFQN